MVRETTGVAFGLVMLCGVSAGCGAGQRESEASAVAEDFTAALDGDDAAAACALLSPETAEALVASEGQACEASIGSLGLPGGAVAEVEVWGDRAQVSTDADVLFLVELGDGWKVAAAGCLPDGDRPYQCEVGS
ncbi:hypothetical protein [Glycomyces harbinensis]|uniref:Uncharacterized protein n=1 Tax=Glycomyces harbinensis TaxID=58114 RepID=A0A1G6UBI6_9ACTN|nr:hypothetical protein [Glycomyces harbinensis]SDD38728.1 hypothetical protein SAMN05216270_103414 [Glycomyces harbinensis]